MAATLKSPAITPEERERIVEWIRGGMARNEVCRRAGRSAGSVSAIAKAEGLSFERAAETHAASFATALDGKERRAKLKTRLIDEAEKLLDQLHKPAVIYGGKDFEPRNIDEPTFGDKRNIMQSVQIALDKAEDLERYDSPNEGKNALLALVVELGRRRPEAEAEAAAVEAVTA